MPGIPLAGKQGMKTFNPSNRTDTASYRPKWPEPEFDAMHKAGAGLESAKADLDYKEANRRLFSVCGAISSIVRLHQQG